MTISGSRVEPGQVWETKDSRDRGRRVHVDQVVPEKRYAMVTTTTTTTTTTAARRPEGRGRQSRVGIQSHGTREVLKGFRLVQHADGTPAGER